MSPEEEEPVSPMSPGPDEDLHVYNVDDYVRYTGQPGPKAKRSLTPITIVVCDTIGLKKSRRILRVLLDSGSMKTLIHRDLLPKGAATKRLSSKKKVTTLAGDFSPKEMVYLRDLRLPEFDKNRAIDEQKALVFEGKCRYDIILGADFLEKTGIDIKYSTKEMEWYGLTIPLRHANDLFQEDYDQMMETFLVQTEDEEFGEDWLEAYVANPILDAKYEETSAAEVAAKQTHLTDSQKADLERLLSKYSKLFDGSLGKYPHKEFHIELEEKARPVHSRSYPVPRVHHDVFKKELNHLCELGVLEKVLGSPSEWASPSFITPKKDGRVRFITDLRQLNKVIKRKVHPLPLINEVLKKRPGYKFLTKLDVSMQYYTFALDDESADLCTIVTPFGKYRYKRLPMGLKCSPDWAQATMEAVLDAIEDAEVYIDDIKCCSDSWEDHLKLLDIVLRRLQDNGFTINPLKCEWAVKETDWLGYWLTPTGLKPWKKKIDAIIQMDRPRNPKQLKSFLGSVNFYRDMWPSRAHILKPLTDLTGKKKLNMKDDWTPECQDAFRKMKAILAMDVLTAYPDHNKTFHIYTDSSDYQMGACIMQDGRPVAFYSKKLTPAQINYTTMEKELLSIVATLKEFRSMLLGAELHVHTDHKNLTFQGFNTQRVQRWRCYLEEYSPTIHYLPGPENVLADNMSRLERLPESFKNPARNAPLHTFNDPLRDQNEQESSLESFYSIYDEPEVIECMLNLPPMFSPMENPLNYTWMRETQQRDQVLQKRLEKSADTRGPYFIKRLDDENDVICYSKNFNERDKYWRIALSAEMVEPTVKWYHQVLGHAGEKRLLQTLKARYHHEDFSSCVKKVIKNCEYCRKHKLPGRGYGLLPERELRIAPFEEVAVDLIRPWKVKVRGKEVTFNALTIIDPVTNLVELVRIDNKTALHIRKKFEQTWLSRYPWPRRCVHDKGKEFIGAAFTSLLERIGVTNATSTTKNPQSNAICERMHQTVGNILRTVLHSNPPANLTTAKDIVDDALYTAMHAMRTTVATTLGSSPGALVFGRDMFLNVPLIADWQVIAQN